MGEAFSLHREEQVQRHRGREDDSARFKEEQRGQCEWNRVSKRENRIQDLSEAAQGVQRSFVPTAIVRALAFTLKELGRAGGVGQRRDRSLTTL